MKNTIHYIVVHCKTLPIENAIESIKQYWTSEEHWKNPGYHYIISKSGRIEKLELEKDFAGNRNHNKRLSIHISFAGDGNTSDHLTKSQVEVMKAMLTELKAIHPKAVIIGENCIDLLSAA